MAACHALEEHRSGKGTPAPGSAFSIMPDDAQRFRERAINCRAVAQGTRNQTDSALLEDMAAELDAEADRIDQEEAERAAVRV